MERLTTSQTPAPELARIPSPARTARDGMRRPLPMTALINFGLHYSQRWPIRDLSTTGAYVEMPGRGLKDGMSIEFVLRLMHEHHAQELRLPASVVRVDDAGAAVAFGQFDDSTYTALVNLLYSG
jgi:hypothetical protein